MNKTLRTTIVLILFFLASLLNAQDLRSIPAAVPGQRVYDEASLLTPEQRDSLAKKIIALEKEKGSQIAVLILDSTEPEAIEAYSIRVFDQWKIGRKKIDDGVLLTVAIKDKKMRIDVGYGLEGALPDAICKRITSEIIKPEFKKGDYYGGIDKGVDAIITVIRGEKLPEPKNDTEDSFQTNLIFTGFLSIFIIVGLAVAWTGSRKSFFFILLLTPILFLGIYYFTKIYILSMFFTAAATFVLSILSSLAGGISGGGSGGGSSYSGSSGSSSDFSSSSSFDSDSSSGSDFGGGDSGGGGSSDSW